MFEVLDEDPAFWEALPFEDLGSIPNETNYVHFGKEKGHSIDRPNRLNMEKQQALPLVKENQGKRKATKRKFPGPAGNLPPSRPLEMRPECVASPLSLGPQEMPEGREPEEPTSSQTCLEEAFSSKPWQRLLFDLGSDASSILSKLSIKSMLINADKKTLPKGKIPLILGYVDRVDCQGFDGSIVLRDPTGQMSGSIHQELIRDPCTAIQVGWVLVLRQVSVISPLRNHYLNITSGNIVAVYRPDKESGVAVTPWPCSGTPPPSPYMQPGSPSSPTNGCISWDRLVRDAENELRDARNSIPNAVILTPPASTMPTGGQGIPMMTSGTRSKARIGQPSHIQPPSLLFAASTHHQSHTARLSHSSLTFARDGKHYQSSTVPQSTDSQQSTEDGFSDDDSDMLSMCDAGAFDESCQTNGGRNKPDHSVIPSSCDNFDTATTSSFVSPSVKTRPLHGSPSRLNYFVQDSSESETAMKDSLTNFDREKRRPFSFKVTPSISSPNCELLTPMSPRLCLGPSLDSGLKSLRLPNASSATEGGNSLNTGRDFKVQLGARLACSKENENQATDVYGQWNDDLSDELLSQLSEEF